MTRPLRFCSNRTRRFFRDCPTRILSFVALALLIPFFGQASPQKALTTPGIVREFPAAIDDVRQAVTSVQHDHTIHGTKMFDKDPALAGAEAVESTPLFELWQGPG